MDRECGSGAAHADRRRARRRARSRSAREADLSPQERQLSGALLRVDHVGEVCAQALYQAQGLTARSPQLRQQMQRAAAEEVDHLAWTERRLEQLGARTSLLNPLWYAGAFGIGLLAGWAGDRWSLGFVVETERQVEQHLAGHLDRLPSADAPSRAIVEQMKVDEAQHAAAAELNGAAPLPVPMQAGHAPGRAGDDANGPLRLKFELAWRCAQRHRQVAPIAPNYSATNS